MDHALDCLMRGQKKYQSTWYFNWGQIGRKENK